MPHSTHVQVQVRYKNKIKKGRGGNYWICAFFYFIEAFLIYLFFIKVQLTYIILVSGAQCSDSLSIYLMKCILNFNKHMLSGLSKRNTKPYSHQRCMRIAFLHNLPVILYISHLCLLCANLKNKNGPSSHLTFYYKSLYMHEFVSLFYFSLVCSSPTDL